MSSFEAANAQHKGTREEQQDAAALRELPGLDEASGEVVGVLADGMGGMSHGAAASQVAVSTFIDAFASKSAQEPPQKALQRSLLVANQAVLAFARANQCERNVAATLVAATISGSSLHWLSVGDSRAYLIRDGKAYRLTVDHTYAQDQWWADSQSSSLQGELKSTAADPDAVSSFVGYPNPPRFDGTVSPLHLLAGDTVLLVTDGMYKAMAESAIPAYFGGELRKGCDAIVQAVLDLRIADQDNVTVVAMRSLRKAKPEAALVLPMPARSRD